MLFRSGLITNTVLCIFFILLELFLLMFAPEKFPDEARMVFMILAVISFISLCFDFICFKLLKANKEHAEVSGNLIITGNIFFVFMIMTGLTFFLMAIAVISVILETGNVSMLRLLIFYILFILIFLICGISIILNLIYFRRLIKINRQTINAYINDIGVR